MSTATKAAKTTKASKPPLTLPTVAIRLGLSLDFVRKQFRIVPALAELARSAGNYRFVEETDMPKIKVLLEAAKV
jgi:hypothetical protein